jgi:hypothetical protein
VYTLLFHVPNVREQTASHRSTSSVLSEIAQMKDELGPTESWTEGPGLTAEGMLPVQALNEIADATWGTLLLAEGFVVLKPRLWVRSRLEFARDLFELCAIKSADYVPRCGLSLNFAPHVQSGALRWHRAAKSVVWDLELSLPDPISGLPAAAGTPGQAIDRRYLRLSRLSSTKFNEHVARHRSSHDVAAGLAQFAQVATLAQLAEAFERRRIDIAKLGRSWSFPQHHIAHAFTLARLNRLAEARLELAKSPDMALASVAARLIEELEKAVLLADPRT